MTASPPPAPGAAPLPSTIDGDRVVRVLSAGERAVTALVHGEGVTRVARILDAACPESLADAEIAVHETVRSAPPALREHAVALDDLVTLPDGRLALLIEQVAGPVLVDVLAARRGGLALGEAVTLLAPLAEALEAAHAVGLTSIDLSPSTVRVRTSGAPVVVRLQQARVGPVLPQRLRDLEPAYAADRAALARLGAAVADAVAEPERAGLIAALRVAELDRPLASALFDLAEPLPLRLDGVGGDAPDRVSAVGIEGEFASPAQESPAALLVDASGASAVPAWLQAALDALSAVGLPAGIVDPVRSAAQALVARRSAITVRPRFLLAGVAGALALVVALVVVASHPSEEAVAGDAGSGEQPVTDSLIEPDGSTTIEALATRSASGDAPEVALHPAPEEWQAIVDALLARWSSCQHNDAPSGCAASAAHPGSAAERLLHEPDPRHAILERWRASQGEAVVVERMGGAVLVDLVTAGTPTASLLIVRSEAGWRVRDVIG